MHSKLFILFLISLLVTSCSVSIQTDLPTITPLSIITATLPPPPTLRPSEIPPSSTSMVPVATPIPGTTSTQLNVRAEPSTASEVLGVIAANTSVQIVGQDPGGNWWQILYEAGTEGKGWVTGQYVETAGKPEVPVIGSDGENPGVANSAVIIQQLNVRSGPDTAFDSIGILNADDVVNLKGRNQDGSWLQIEFSGREGWINTAFVRMGALDSLPIISDAGDAIGTGTPTITPLPATPTIVPAPMDFDSADAPLKTILFDRVGTRTLIYNGDVSAPGGDTDDWIAFIPYDSSVLVNIQCAGNGSLFVEVVEGEPMLECNEMDTVLLVQAGTSYLVHIKAVQSQDSLQYINYILTIKASQ